jgi:hypothetical protein
MGRYLQGNHSTIKESPWALLVRVTQLIMDVVILRAIALLTGSASGVTRLEVCTRGLASLGGCRLLGIVSPCKAVHDTAKRYALNIYLLGRIQVRDTALILLCKASFIVLGADAVGELACVVAGSHRCGNVITDESCL